MRGEKPILNPGAPDTAEETFDRQLSTLRVAWQEVYWAIRHFLWHAPPSTHPIRRSTATSREHFTSWICRWQTQLNPQPLLIAALAWQSHCGSRWCPLGVLQRQGDRTRENEQQTGNTGCISTQLNHAVSTQQEHWHLCESQMNHLMYSSMDLSYSYLISPIRTVAASPKGRGTQTCNDAHSLNVSV